MIKSKKIIAITIPLLLILLILLIIICLFKLKKPFFGYEKRDKQIIKAKEKSDYPVIGWIRVQGTNIDYYIMGRSDDGKEKYPVEVDEYAWTSSNDGKYHNVLNIFGHNVMNLGATPMKNDESFHRFESLASFLYYDFVKDNKYIQLSMDGKDYIYQVFSVGIESDYYIYTLPNGDYSKKEKQEYLDLVKDNSIYDFDVDVDLDDNYITLVTCTRIYGSVTDSIYVSGKLVDNGEKKKYDNYEVKKNNNYKKVEGAMKGDVQNAEDDA